MSQLTTHHARDRFILRFPSEGQRDQIKAQAARNHRSMNAEVLYLIERGWEAVYGKQGSKS